VLKSGPYAHPASTEGFKNVKKRLNKWFAALDASALHPQLQGTGALVFVYYWRLLDAVVLSHCSLSPLTLETKPTQIIICHLQLFICHLQLSVLP
jgi:hypothetical protein